MSKEYWFPWQPARFRADTMHLTAEQDGIYRRLIDHYMETKLPLPDNDAALARIAGISFDSWLMAAAILRPFFRQQDGRLWLKKCDEILADQAARSEKNSRKGKAGARSRWKASSDIPEENDRSNTPTIGELKPEDSTRQDITEHRGGGGSARELDPRFVTIRLRIVEQFPDLVAKESSIILAWLAEADMDLDILPQIDVAKAQNSRPSGFGYFTPMILRAKETRLSPLSKGNPHGNSGHNSNRGGNPSAGRKTKSEAADDAMHLALTDLGILDEKRAG